MSETWNIDASHSSVDFKVRHMGISSVKGSFDSFSGSVIQENDELKEVNVDIEVASINTNDEQRDGHLKSADFFDVENNPKMSFKSTAISKNADGSYAVTGDLSMKGTSKPVSFQATIGEAITDPWGMTRAAAEITGTLNRKDWGLSWNQILEAGALLVGEEVSFNFDVQAVKG